MVGALSRKGNVQAITLEPKPNGNVLLFKARAVGMGEVLQCRTFAGFALDEMRAQGVPLRLDHHVDCPDAARFARSR